MLFITGNHPMQTTAPPAAVTTGTATKTMLQIATATTRPIRVVKWSVQFATAPTAPITCELIETGTVFATVTAHGAGGVQPYDRGVTAGAVSIVQLGTALTGYTASAEGTIVATRVGDIQVIPIGVGSYTWEWSLGREFEVAAGRSLRVRMTTATTIGALCWIVYDE